MRRWGAAGLSAGLALGASPLLLSSSATAAVTVGDNITAFPNRDMVVAVGYEEGETLVVQVERDGRVIGRASGPAVETPEGIGVEVNHGPLNEALPGDCWEGVTPDIIGGDVIRVTTGRGQDSMTVTDLDFTGAPQLGADGEVFVDGTALAPGGGRLAASEFIVEFRRDKPTPRFRRGPFAASYADETSNTWRATFTPTATTSPEGLTTEEQRRIALEEATWMAVADNVTETTIAELGEDGGPAAGCEEIAPAEQNTVASGYQSAINIDSSDMVLAGTAREGVAAVNIIVGTLPPREADLSDNTTGEKTWSVTIPKGDLLSLPDGSHTISSTFDGLAGTERTVLKDVEAPALPAASPPAGTYSTTQHVSFSFADEPLGRIYYEIGAAETVRTPSSTSKLYTNQSPAIPVSATQTIKAHLVDRAGNVGPVATLDYKIGTPTAAPTNVSATEGRASVAISWDAVTGAVSYNVYRDGATTPLNASPVTATRFTDTTATDGTHTYAVRALETNGLESASSASATVTLGAPATPRGLTAAAGDARVTLGWSGNSEVDMAGYRVYREGVATALVTTAETARSYIHTGLSNGTTYTYSITAVDDAGNESPRTGVVQATPQAAVVVSRPGAPTIGPAAAGNGSATVAWEPPTNTGGAAISEYRIQVRTGTTVLRTVTGVAGTATTTTVNALTNGTAYNFRVRAVNSVGEGALSAASNTVTPRAPVTATAPGAPVIGTAAAGVAGGAITATANWAEPASNGGAAIDGYQVRAQQLNASGVVVGTTTSTVQAATRRTLAMTLPVNGARYRFHVRARNSVGWSLWSASSNIVIGR